MTRSYTMPTDNTGSSRRELLKYIGAGVAGTGIAGCTGGGDGGDGGGSPETVVKTVIKEGEPQTVVKERTVVKEKDSTRRITALGGITGGSGYMQCLVFQQAVHKEFDNVRVTVSGTDGWKTDAKLMWSRGRSEFGIVPAKDLWAITHGNDPYAEENNYISMAFPGVPPSYIHIVVPQSSDLEYFSDLSGKTVNILSRGSLTDATVPGVLEAVGATDVSYQHYPHQEAANRLSQGGIAAAAAAGIASPYGEMSQQTPVRVLSVKEENQAAIKEQLPSLGFSTVDFSEYYNGSGESTIPSTWILMAALSSLEPDFVYDMTKAMYTHAAEIGASGFNVYQAMDMLEPELADDPGMPVHPGAYRFYEEEGVSIPDELAPPHDFPL